MCNVNLSQVVITGWGGRPALVVKREGGNVRVGGWRWREGREGTGGGMSRGPRGEMEGRGWQRALREIAECPHLQKMNPSVFCV